MTHDTVECSDCGALIDTESDIPENRTPCPVCGKNGRTFNAFIEETIILRDGLGMKAKRPGESRPYMEDKAMPSVSHRLGKHVLREQVIDRDNNRYFEKVTDYDSGEVIHHNVEPLSKHRGHGSAKVKKEAKNG
jgi:hypothetical protein